MKKYLIFVLSLAVMLTLCACGGNAGAPTDPVTEAPTQAERCYHTFTSAVTEEATCEVKGTLTYTCSLCDFSYTEVIEIADHNFSEATCIDAQFCAYCGLYRGEAKGHTFNDATCTAAAVCISCGQTQGSALGHSYEEGFCINCGQEEA